ncbi:hypothetical protein [Kiloniella sp.]|uniref:hypothetical protein n=1 Tax=Kiloniella sp. TaxID=1938587 RepID=UPI003B0129C8
MALKIEGKKEGYNKFLKITLLLSLTINIFIAGWFAGSFVTSKVFNRPPPPPFDHFDDRMPPPRGMIMLPPMIRRGIANLSPEGQEIIRSALISENLMGPPPGFIGQHERLRKIIEADDFDEAAFDRETEEIRKQALARISATMDVFTRSFKKLSREDRLMLVNWRGSMLRKLSQ